MEAETYKKSEKLEIIVNFKNKLKNKIKKYNLFKKNIR